MNIQDRTSKLTKTEMWGKIKIHYSIVILFDYMVLYTSAT